LLSRPNGTAGSVRELSQNWLVVGWKEVGGGYRAFRAVNSHNQKKEKGATKMRPGRGKIAFSVYR